MKSRCASAAAFSLILVFVWVISIGTTPAQSGGRLVVLRSPSFGWNLALNLQIDGKTAANLVQGRRYDHFFPAGRHVLTVSSEELKDTKVMWTMFGGVTVYHAQP